MSFRLSLRVFCLSILFLFGFQTFNAYADFKLLDAIEEFGEKRFVKTKPGRIKAGPLKIHPSLRSSVTYDSNILLEENDAREDVVYNIQPGVILELPINKHQLAVGYEADFENFTKSRHHNQNDQNQNFFALADLRFTNWYINVLERFSETSGRAGTTFTSRIPRYDQVIQPKIGYRWKRFTLEGGFRYFMRDFRQQVNDSFDFEETAWTGVLYYDLFARLKALIEYQASQMDYDDNFLRAGTFQQVRVGLDGEPFRNLRVKVRGGVQFRNYEESSETDFNSFVGDIWAEYKIRPDLKLTARAGREPVEATFGEVNYYLEHRAGFGVEYSPWKKWTLFASFDYIRHTYSERETLGAQTGYRKDNHFGGRYGIRRLVSDWMEIELAYQHLNRLSNFTGLDYTDHRVSLSSNLTY